MGKNPEDAYFLLGISHKTAPVEVRERISFDSEQTDEIASGIHGLEGISECVVLSTCNRTEIYVVRTGRPKSLWKRIGDFLAEASGLGPELFNYFYSSEGLEVAHHLFRVACGLDSMILGEPQILGQVKSAYSLACDHKTTGPAINRLFHHAFRVGKRIRSSTSIGSGAVSVSYAAVELAKQTFGDLGGKSALLVGAGEAGELCAQRLADSGIHKIFIANRTASRASHLADKLDGETVPMEQMLELSASADILITSVAAREPIIMKNDILPFLKTRGGHPLLLIDLGVPRNIEASVSELENARLYNIDDLENVILDNRDRRKLEAEKACELVRLEVEDFCLRLSERAVAPVIREMHDRCETVRRSELDRVKGRVNAETLDLLDLVTRRIVRKILHNPTVAVRSSESGEMRERLLQSVQVLFMGKGHVDGQPENAGSCMDTRFGGHDVE